MPLLDIGFNIVFEASKTKAVINLYCANQHDASLSSIHVPGLKTLLNLLQCYFENGSLYAAIG